DLPTPPAVAQGAKDAIDQRKSTYSRYEGVESLRREIAMKLARDNGMHGVDPETQIVVTVGSTGAFATTCLALFDPGDEVILFEPYYGYHLNTLRVAECKPVFVPMAPPDWTIDLKKLERAITKKTRAIMICTPSNPCGKVWTREEILAVGKLAEKHDLLLITDEIYEYITYDGRKHVCPAAVGDLARRTIAMGGFSKTFSITGWRIGYLVAPPALAKTIGLVNDLHYVCAPTPLQVGVAKGIAEIGVEYYRDLARDYQVKRDMIVKSLRVAGFEPYVPQGAYYLLADFRKLGWKNAKEASTEILQKAKIASVPGTAFYADPVGDTMVRFCFAKDMDVLEEACRRIESLKDIRPASVTTLPAAASAKKARAKGAKTSRTAAARKTARRAR
ncbi:MAG TPA: pyridoxal phosphate-dependent aminotransferase, partial [bacterium]|nr:pyridoxal phosphate-dependent aminotransferase [bacterium]